MSRSQEIEQYLEYFKKAYIQNPDCEYTSDSFYGRLMNYGMEYDRSVDINNRNTRVIRPLFEKLEEIFKKSNLLVYEDVRQPRFLQFRNTKGVDCETVGNCYKLYVSFPKDKIEECVKDIFSFILRNKMVTVSKVAEIVRSDSVVLRMFNQADAIKVMNYINNNRKLVQAALPTNPFLQRSGVVGCGYDYNMSYNEVVSMLLYDYFGEKRKNNQLNTVCLEDLKRHVHDLYNNLENGHNINHTVYQIIGTKYPIHDQEERILNVKHILEILGQSLEDNKMINNYISSVAEFKNKDKQDFEKEKLQQQLLNDQAQKQSDETVKLKNKDEFEPDRMDILNSYIVYAVKKYGIKKAYGYLLCYVQGNPNGITRDCNYRELFSKFVPPSFIIKMIGNNIQQYMSNYVANYYRMIYENACSATVNKYGVEQLKNALMYALEGDFLRFTNDNNARVNLINEVPYEVICQFAQQDLTQINEKSSKR